MAICGCGLLAHCCQPAVSGGFIYADLWGELSIHLALQALFTQSSPVQSCCYKLSPFQAHWGRWHCTCFLRPACLFTSHMGSGSSSSPPTTTFTSFPASGCWAHTAAPALSSQAQLFYLQFREGFPSPLLWRSVSPTLFPMCFYCSYCLLLSFSFFSLDGGQSVQGAMLIWPRVFCGSTIYCLAHLVVHVFPSLLGTGSGRGIGALLVSPFNLKWRFSSQAGGVKGSKFCLFSVALPARCVSSVSPRFYFRRHAFCFLTLAAILESPQ
jgi:hypothetical protein